MGKGETASKINIFSKHAKRVYIQEKVPSHVTVAVTSPRHESIVGGFKFPCEAFSTFCIKQKSTFQILKMSVAHSAFGSLHRVAHA
jgi:hypothetical protein